MRVWGLGFGVGGLGFGVWGFGAEFWRGQEELGALGLDTCQLTNVKLESWNETCHLKENPKKHEATRWATRVSFPSMLKGVTLPNCVKLGPKVDCVLQVDF